MRSYIVTPRFYDQIASGTMRQFFQPPRPDHVKVGDGLRLVDKFGSALISDTICAYVARAEIIWQAGHITHIREGGIPLVHLDKFAEACGYVALWDMEEEFGRLWGRTFFEGYVIGWTRTSVAVGAGEVAA